MTAQTSATGSDQNRLESLRGVGPRVAEKLARLGIETVTDLLFHLPLRYEDRTRVVAIGALQPGSQAVIEAEVALSEIAFGRRRSLLCRVSDGTGQLTLRFFHFSAAQKNTLARGTRLRCFGEVRAGRSGLEMVHPEYRLLGESESPPEADVLTPVYPATEGVHQLKLRDLTSQALARLADGRLALPELLPDSLRERAGRYSLAAALACVHRPPADADIDALSEGRHPAQQRLAFEELLAHHLSLRRLRSRARSHQAPPLRDRSLMTRLSERLPFALTAAQQRVIDEILTDLADARPMMRLVQGDVGSGKTLVAVAAALAAIGSGWQAALMAPTELLAEQHARNIDGWLRPLGVDTVLIGGRLKGAARSEALSRVAGGRAGMVVGTHALFQDEVSFDRLGLVIVDEQHRFGVHQRLALRQKGMRDGLRPHQLIMTATPIPRTLAMAAYADLDVSVIDELPPGRTPVTTVVVPDSRRDEVVARVHRACRAGRQAYWVCPLVEESEALQCQAAEETAGRLRQALDDVRIGLVHGRMKPDAKEAVMQAFKAGDIDLLVATTVIEVGVDVPNASLMIIDNAERLGLAQLHQLRGRVGRGSAQSSCVLMYHGPLSRNARARLDILRETSDGFRIAQRDLEIRGPGEVLGVRQTGMLQLRVADLERDADIMPDVQQAADVLLAQYPQQAERLVRRWLGHAAQYGEV